MPRRRPDRRVRITPEILTPQQLEETKENIPPIPFGSQTNTNDTLDVIFSRYIDPVTIAQKKYLEEQTEAFNEEKFLLERLTGDLRDLLNSIYNYELRVKPDANVPLFFDREYQNFKRRMQIYDMMKLVVDKYALFQEGIEEEIPETSTDDESLAETQFVISDI
jgi:hypothetical protein